MSQYAPKYAQPSAILAEGLLAMLSFTFTVLSWNFVLSCLFKAYSKSTLLLLKAYCMHSSRYPGCAGPADH